MIAITLKYPTGEFTQAELAEFNGMEKLAVYLPLREAVDNGTLTKAGTRATEGARRPSNLYRVANNNAQVPVPASQVTQSLSEIPLTPLTPPVVNQVPNPPYAVILAKELNKALQEHRPPSVPNPAYPCPLCNGPMTEIPDADNRGMTVVCYNPCDPQCHENPFGHSSNSKAAYEVAKQKFLK